MRIVQNFFTRLMLSCTVAVLAGCGGGGDGGMSGAGNGLAAPTGPLAGAASELFDIGRSLNRIGLLAGSADQHGSADGPGEAARFSGPYGIVSDAGGNFYVADVFNATIRKIGQTGQVSTVAGLAQSVGTADGSGAAARFSAPYGIAIDSGGTLYVADTGSHTIRKIAPGGAVTTLAGTAGVSGSADGTGAAAQFQSPYGIAAGADGNLYVADTGNHAIRRITPGGAVSTLAGLAQSSGSVDGSSAMARFNRPYAIAAGPDGSLLVSDTYNHTIRQILRDGTVQTIAGIAGQAGSADGTGAAARFNYPQGLAVDASGTLYVADTLNSTVRKIVPDGTVETVAGKAGIDGLLPGALPAGLARPFGIAVTPAGLIGITSGNSVVAIKFKNAAE